MDIFENKLKNIWFRYILITIIVVMFMTNCLFTLLGGSQYIGDFHMYVSIAQAMDSGLVLYKDAVDVKNMGFFFIFLGIYKIYKLFFMDMSYFYVFTNIILCLVYIIIAFLSYNIVYSLYKKHVQAFCYSIFTILFFGSIHHAWFLNQPQLSLIFILILTWIIVKKKENFEFSDYFIYGIILGIAFSTASPYIALTLIIPILAFRDNTNILSILGKSIIAFIGFSLPLIPFFVYFLKNDALLDWWYMNFRHATLYNLNDTAKVLFFNIHIIEAFLGTIIVHGKSMGAVPIGIFMFFLYGVWIYLIKIKAIKHIKTVDKSKQLMLIIAILALLSRLLLVRNSSSYQFYFITFMIYLLPLCIELYNKEKNNNKLRQNIVVIMLIISTFAIIFPVYLASKTPTYDKKTAAIIKNNKHKKPTYVSVSVGAYSFATDWTSLYHNVYDGDIANITKKYSPEVIFVAKHQLNNEFVEEFSRLYQRVSDRMCIRIDMLETWNLEGFEIKDKNPIKPLFVL